MRETNLITTSLDIIKYGFNGLKKYASLNPNTCFYISTDEIDKLREFEGSNKEEGFNQKNFLRALEFLDKKSVSNGVDLYKDGELTLHVVDSKNFQMVKFKRNLQEFDKKSLKSIKKATKHKSEFSGITAFLFALFFIAVPIGIHLWISIELWVPLVIAVPHALIVYYFRFVKKPKQCYRMFFALMFLNLPIFISMILLGTDAFIYLFAMLIYGIPYLAFLVFMCIIFCVVGDDYQVENS